MQPRTQLTFIAPYVLNLSIDAYYVPCLSIYQTVFGFNLKDETGLNICVIAESIQHPTSLRQGHGSIRALQGQEQDQRPKTEERQQKISPSSQLHREAKREKTGEEEDT